LTPVTPDLEMLHEARGGLFEAPRYHPGFGLLFTDARLGGVWLREASAAAKVVVPHRRGIGGLALHALDGLVITGRNVAHKTLDWAGSEVTTTVLLDAGDVAGVAGFNDLTVDTQGRVYVGSLAPGALEASAPLRASPGGVFRIDLDGSVRLAAGHMLVPNGMAFSPDGTLLYAVDSGRKVVYSFPVDAETGDLGDRKVVVEVDTGVPDGMAVAEDGSLWVAQAYAGLIGRYAPTGVLVEGWAIPALMVTSLCFGGDDGRHVFVTTGAATADGTAAIYAGQSDVAGAPVPPVRVTVGP
jgi:sugar lactone lactonase YvrE